MYWNANIVAGLGTKVKLFGHSNINNNYILSHIITIMIRPFLDTFVKFFQNLALFEKSGLLLKNLTPL
jgi:hypothetical protein